MPAKRHVMHGRDHERSGADPFLLAWESVGNGGGGTPVIVGNNQKGTVLQNVTSARRMWVGKFPLATAGTLTELHGWFRGCATAQNVRLIVYDDDGASAMPGTRLAYTASYALPLSADAEVIEIGLAVPLAAGDYWLGWIHELSVGGTCGGYYLDGGPVTQYATSSTYTPPQTPFGTPTANFAQTLSIWGIVMT